MSVTPCHPISRTKISGRATGRVFGPTARRLLLPLVGMLALGACGGGGAPPPPAREWTDPGQVVAGEWALYYNAFRTADLDPAMAKAYDLQPRARGAVVTVSLTKGGDPRPAAEADVKIEARTLLGQARPVNTRRIERDGVVSWLGELEAGDRETLVFAVKAGVPGAAAPLAAEFRREFHGDD
jgi:hypothetical protein